MTCGYPVPILRTFDEARAKAFYCEFLGFAVTFEHRFEPGLPLHMGLKLGACELHVSEHYGDATPGSAVRIPVDDVIRYATELRAKDFGSARPGKPKQTPWGTQEITVIDPAGNRLTFFSARAA